MTLFAEGGFSNIAENIDKNIKAEEREKAVQTYLKIIDVASVELYKNRFNLKDENLNKSRTLFVQDALNAYNDMFFTGLLIILS